MVSAHQVVRGRFGRRIGAVGSISSGFRKFGVFGLERSVNFIGGNVEEAEVLFVRRIEGGAVSPHFFQKRKGPVYIGEDEIVGAVDGTIHMAFRSEMNDGAGLMVFQ